MIRIDPSIVDKLYFGEDMTTMAYSTVYTGTFPHIQPSSWTIVLRYMYVEVACMILQLFVCCCCFSSEFSIITIHYT